jgi:cellulose synthase/poly-beta-1,6-N-acetylglucosamine synthase-like glycosyltransferase
VAAIRLAFLQELGGWDEDALCDDTDITFAAALRGLRVVYDPDIVSWEEGVDNLRAYVKQRTRWARGHMRVFAKYWFPVMFSSLPLRQKIDGFLLLSFYFVPVCVGLSMALTALDFLLLRRTPSALDGFGLSLFLYCAPALFLQLLSGLYYRRAKVQRYFCVLLLPLFSVLNIAICFRALRMEIFGIQRNVWVKTQRTGKVMNDLAVIQANTPLPAEAVLEGSGTSQRPAR